MPVENDDKPRVILEEHKVVQNMPPSATVYDEPFTVHNFVKRLKIVIISSDENELEFDMIGIHCALANTFRRIMLCEVPSMAIDKVHIFNNTSIIQDEVLAHRLGLIPLKADPRLFEYKNDDSVEGTETDTLEFELKIKCTYNKDGNKDSSCAEDMYKNNNVYSKHIKWIPKGNQKEKFSEKDVGSIHDDILIAKLRPGHEIDMRLFAIKSDARDHAKFSPVCTAHYRMLPEITLTREFEGEEAERLQKCFSNGVIGIRKANGKRIAEVRSARYDMSCRNIMQFPDLRDSVITQKVKDHFIFNVESVGALKPEDIFIEAVKVLRNKCHTILDELNKI